MNGILKDWITEQDDKDKDKDKEWIYGLKNEWMNKRISKQMQL